MRIEREEPEYNDNDNPQCCKSLNETVRNGKSRDRQRKKGNSK